MLPNNPRIKDLALTLSGLRKRKWSLAFAESCTAGRLSSDMTSVPGSSDVVAGSAVCYQLRAKHKILGLREVTEETVVSEKTAIAMAQATLRLFDANVGVATTGYLDGNNPHAYWAICAPSFGLPQTTYAETLTCRSGRVDFAKTTPRDINREVIVRVVFEELLCFALLDG